MSAALTPYTGPGDAYWRFMAGRTVTLEQFVSDQSPWIVAPMSEWHNSLLTEMLAATEVDFYRNQFNDIVFGVSL